MGIGTTAPSVMLDVNDTTSITLFTGTTTEGLVLRNSGASNDLNMISFSDANAPRSFARIAAYKTSNGSFLGFGTSNSYVSGITNQALTIDYNGNVGIGATAPSVALEVNGRVKDKTGYLDPVGSIISYGGSSAPTGWLLCDGSAISRTTYADLFAVLGTTYGTGDGSTTFNIPDFRGVFPKGAGTTNRAAGKDASGNFYTDTLGLYSQDQMQGHRHSPSTPIWVDNPNQNRYQSTGDVGIAQNVQAVGPPSTDGTNGTPRTGHTTEPQSLGVNFIIKY